MDELMRAYGKYTRFVSKHFPLGFHKDAHLAAQASMAAHAQGKFWQYRKILFANFRNLKRKDLERYAKKIKLDMVKFKLALDKSTYRALVDKDIALGRKIGVNATPTIYINGHKVSVRYRFQNFKRLLDPILLKHGVKKKDLPTRPKKLFPLANSPWKGSKKPLVTIVKFASFQCPFCQNVSFKVRGVVRAYRKHVRFVFKHYPLRFQKQSYLAAQASMAAHAQGKFWEYHDLLYQDISKLHRTDLERHAKKLGLDMKKFKAALDKGTYRVAVDRDTALGNRNGVSGTPAFFIDGHYANVYDFITFQRILEPLLLKRGVKKEELPLGPNWHIPAGKAPWRGSKKPMVTIVAFMNFQEIFSSHSTKLLKALHKKYQKHVRFVFKHYPTSLHRYASLAAQASMAAHAQGKFWEYHDLLFANRTKLMRGDLEGYAKKLGLDMKRFKEDLDKKRYLKLIEKDVAFGNKISVGSVPAVYVNGTRFSTYSLKDWTKMLDKLLKKGLKK